MRRSVRSRRRFCREGRHGSNDFETENVGIRTPMRPPFCACVCRLSPACQREQFPYSRFGGNRAPSSPGCQASFRLPARNALTDHVTLELRNAGENLEQQAAGGVLFVGIKRLAGSDEPHAVAGERRQLLIQVQHTSAEPVDFAYAKARKSVLGGVSHAAIQSGAAGLAAAEAGVDVLAADLPATAGDVLPQFPQLHFAVLIGCRNTGVQGATHSLIVHYFRTLCQDRRSPRTLWQSNAVWSPHPIGSMSRRVANARNGLRNSEWGLPISYGKVIPGRFF